MLSSLFRSDGQQQQQQQQGQTLGVSVGSSSMKEQLDQMTRAVTKREVSLNRYLTINKKERVLADRLATAYVHNYSVMVDITGLLNQFAEFFKTMKDILNRSNIQLDQLNSDAFQNIERLTRQEMDRYTTKFYEQSQRVQKLFQDYQMHDKANKLASIPGMTQQLTEAADAVKMAKAASGGKGPKKARKPREPKRKVT